MLHAGCAGTGGSDTIWESGLPIKEESGKGGHQN